MFSSSSHNLITGMKTNNESQDEKLVVHNKQRGKNSSLRRHLRKTGKKNIIDERRLKLEAMKKQRLRAATGEADERKKLGPALSRFYRPSER